MSAFQNQPVSVIVDTDGGVDDALALIMALNSPQLDLKAITVVAGNINVEQAANNVLRVISIVEPDTSPIVAKGCEKPLLKPPFNAAGIHGQMVWVSWINLRKRMVHLAIPNLLLSHLQRMLLICFFRQLKSTII